MRKSLIILALLFTASTAEAKITRLNASCPAGIEFHADDGGYVYINGKPAKLKIHNADAYDAVLGHTTISVAVNPDGSTDVFYTASGGANGVCTVK